jgi:diketogulonate reductase-like aldo/keto reductase
MIKSITDSATLNNGVEIPWLGFGVFQLEPGEVTELAVSKALEVGYRSVDTASIYENEASVGKAVKESGIPREEIFITTKVWNTEQGYQSTLNAFEDSRKKLDVDYVDLYLVHWPVIGRYVETWKALEKLYKDGIVRAIGVSNFQIPDLQEILDICEIKPVLNQVELHPVFRRAELHQFCARNQIQMEAWAPLHQGQALDIPVIVNIAKKYGKSPAQVLIRWDLDIEVVTIPKSVTPQRIAENADVFDFELSPEDLAAIAALNEEKMTLEYPENCGYDVIG